MDIKLAEALLRRKELQAKVDQLKSIPTQSLFQTVGKRVKVTDNIDDLIAQVPKIKPEQLTAASDFYAKRLRMIDALIQQANWTTVMDVDKTIMDDYVSPEEKREG